MKIQLTYRTFYMHSMELCVSLNQLFNWFFLFQQVVWKSTHPLHNSMSFTISVQYICWDSFDCFISLPIVSFALFQWIEHGVQPVWTWTFWVCNIQFSSCALLDKDNTKWQSFWKPLNYIDLYANLSAWFRQYTCCVRWYFWGMACFAIHFIVVILYIHLSIFLRLTLNAFVHRMSVILTWSAQFTTVCVCTFSMAISVTLFWTYHWINMYTFFMVFITLFLTIQLHFSVRTASLISIYHNILNFPQFARCHSLNGKMP